MYHSDTGKDRRKKEISGQGMAADLRARHGSRLTLSSLHGLHVYTESEAKEVCWHMWRSLACPSTSRTLFSGLRVSTHGKQVAPYSVRFLLISQEGGVGPILPRVPHGGLSWLSQCLTQSAAKVMPGQSIFLSTLFLGKPAQSWLPVLSAHSFTIN